MHLYNETIDVSCKQDIPQLVAWRGGVYHVDRVLDTWTARHAWWTTEEFRRYLLLETTMGVMEIYLGPRGWVLSRVFD
ncbi:MAG TPA: hypothetical protein DIS79_03930 [Bacteroidetes bacterium]|nr:hypothetical protein [Bacteroidota bacterium]HRK06035.1 DUF6504 family protein [Chlorobiota bacterium]